MFTQFFGNFLLNGRYVTREQLIDALQEKKNVRLQLGVLAINAGYMTASQVEQVHIMQTRVDKRIGELAVEAGFLTSEQVLELIGSQQPGYLLLGQALVDKGYMTNSDFEKAINDYKEKYALTDEDLNKSSNTKAEVLVKTLFNLGNNSNEKYISIYVSLLINNLVRFIGDDFTILNPIRSISSNTKLYKTSQGIKGSFDTETSILMQDDAMKYFSSRYSDEEIEKIDEYTESIVCDFINLHNGIFAVNMSNEQGVELSLTPPLSTDSDEMFDDNLFILPVSYPFGIINFALSF